MTTITKYKLQGIFYVWFPEQGRWLYTVRDDVDGPQDADRKVHQLSKQFGNQPALVTIEDWNHPKSEHHGYHYSMTVTPKQEA